MNDSTKVPIGVTSIVGWTTAALAAVPLIVKTIQEGTAAFQIGGPEKWIALFGIVSLALTQLGRYLQAAIQAKPAPEPEQYLPDTEVDVAVDTEPDAPPADAGGEARLPADDPDAAP